MKNKKRNRVFLLLILILAISIGFAILSTTLKINGTTGIGKNTWDVHWANVGDVQKSDGTVIRENGAAKVDASDNTLVTFNVKLNQPGDFYEFQVDAVNAGTLDAMVQVLPSITVAGDGTTLPDYLKFTVKYADGGDIEQYHLLAKAEDLTSTPPVYTTERYKVRLEFSTDVDEEDLAEIDTKNEYIINLETPYIQADENAKSRRLRVGDRFTLVPDKTTATTTYAGFSGSDQYMINRWRVIEIKDNGQIEAVADYASGHITITGADGYKNYVAGLQDLASCYAKEGYTVATRAFGYDGQTLVLSDTSAFDGSSYQYPSDTETPDIYTGEGQEYGGGVLGDNLYIKDYQKVMDVYGTLYTYTPFWIASRHYRYNYEQSYGFGGFRSSGNILMYSDMRFRSENTWYNPTDQAHSLDPEYAMRPIITLRSGITIASGEGTQASPYTLN